MVYNRNFHHEDEPEILKIFRLLKPEHQTELLVWVNLAYTAENSIKKALDIDVLTDEIPLHKSH